MSPVIKSVIVSKMDYCQSVYLLIYVFAPTPKSQKNAKLL